ncbi:hypothetical protein BDZ94DRAFT_1298055 [Collybia nuda]|uniref:Uncharacterized protein n=1 Tax=Collybia nuda TaxID=64659 RepID=A0A9P6CEL2_9AGAR|nr:hypothetical protein BDZ94DRAFT_1298055 [Collybia nuda]
MAPTFPDGISMDQLLAALAQIGFVPSIEQSTRLNSIGGGGLVPVVTGVTISAPNNTPVTMPVVIISDDEDDTYPGYPRDDGSESEREEPPTIDTTCTNTSAPRSGAVAGNSLEGVGPKPGAFLECTVCGTQFDLTPREHTF